MAAGSFKFCVMSEENPKWQQATQRCRALYESPGEIRSAFGRDYTRILHSTAYRRLKHKTQVFFATTNDHICTRIEHVNHVTSVGRTISNYLGLNTELVEAIAIGHDIGHAPFGHQGEQILDNLAKNSPSQSSFWHEGNSLRFADFIEVLEGPDGEYINLDLTYAVRDGIICHCGEDDDQSLKPRADAINLETITKKSHTKPYSWEGCVVKISDKISYLGRDIEDARRLQVLDDEKVEKLNGILRKHFDDTTLSSANTFLIKTFIKDLCTHSNPDDGIRLSPNVHDLMLEIKHFCYEKIYKHEVLERYKLFVEHVIKSLFDVLKQIVDNYSRGDTSTNLFCPILEKDFTDFLQCYSQHKTFNHYTLNLRIYDLSKIYDKIQACIDFLSGMTDQYALKSFREIISY